MHRILGMFSRSVGLGISLAFLAASVTALVCWQQAAQERRQSVDDLDRRARVLLTRLEPSVDSALALPEGHLRSSLGDRLDGLSRLLGFALVDAEGQTLAAGRDMPELAGPLLTASLAPIKDPGASSGAAMVATSAGIIHVRSHAIAASQNKPAVALVVLHDAAYIEERTTRAIVRGMIWTVGVFFGILALASGGAWALFERPLNMLADWMRTLRSGAEPQRLPRGLPVRRLADESERLAMSLRAARTEEWDRAQDLLRSERAWDRERLRAHAIESLGGAPLVVISNREPYMHQYKDGHPQLVTPASGLVTGLDPVLRACGGLWVAHGAGEADRQTAGPTGCIAVPPSDPRYTLKRVWISKEEEEGYYYGFSNEGLWPLCHLTHERPVFRASDWEQYVRANQRFADAALEEIGEHSAVVMVQDYQLALVPGMIKQRRPDLRVGLFWHIPWPNPEAFRICPFREPILQGMLGADLIGFHLQQHCNNFLETVDRMVEARLDWDRFAADLRGHTALVRPFPISVQPWSERSVMQGEQLAQRIAAVRAQHGLEGVRLAVGVDRLDYTKGIAERLRAIDRYFDHNPHQKGRVTFVQLGAPSRTHIPRYRELIAELEALVDKINWKHGADGRGEIRWKPVSLLVDHHDGHAVHTFMSAADVCIVSSLHDGMNLVAKEYVSAKTAVPAEPGGGPGVLVLSEFAGAARDLPEALIVNPYDTEQFARAIQTAFEMPSEEAAVRMQQMRRRVDTNNIYRWAAEFLAALSQAGKGVSAERAASPNAC